MSSRVERQVHLLQAIAEGHPQVVKTILRGADNDLIKCLAECALNLLRGNIVLTPEEKKKLIKYRHKIRTIADKKQILKDHSDRWISSGSVSAFDKTIDCSTSWKVNN